MNIYIDITSISYKDDHAGIHRLLKAIIKFFPEICKTNDECHFVRYSISQNRYVNICFNGNTWQEISYVQFQENSIFFKADLNPYSAPYGLYQQLKRLNIKIVTICYDLVYILFPEFFVHSNHANVLKENLDNDINLADLIICISQAVENELLVYAREKKPKTSYFHPGADFNSTKILQKNKSKSKSKTIKFLAVSTVEPRKGYYELVQAFDKVLISGFDASLTIIGRDGWNNDDDKNAILKSPYFNSNIFWNENCNDEHLLKYYNESDCFIFPSVYEGFGLGLVEAAHYGLPLLLRDLPVFREIAKENAIYFDQYSSTLEEQIIYCIKNIKALPNSQKIRIYSWKESIEHLYSAVIKVLD